MGYRGKVELQEQARKFRADGRTLVRHRGRARRREVVGVALGARRAVRAARAPHRRRPPAASPPHRQARRDRRLRPLAASRGSAFSPRKPSWLPALPSTPARGRRRRQGDVREHRTRRWLRSSARGCGGSSTIDERRLRVRVYLPRRARSRCGRAVLVRNHRHSTVAVSGVRTGRRPIRPMRRNKHEHGCAYVGLLRARAPIGRSWAWSGRC